MKKLFWRIEDLIWGIRCSYNLWLHGPYGLSKVIERMPFRFLIKYLRKYGATIGENCRFERGLNVHRPIGKKPFENLILGNNVYLGHNLLVDLSKSIKINNGVMIGARSQIWTHAGYYANKDAEKGNYQERSKDVVIMDGTIIYSNVVISPGVTVGKMVEAVKKIFI
jgi:acetyltransferase-like isoleucine patch superfamily enzyme